MKGIEKNINTDALHLVHDYLLCGGIVIFLKKLIGKSNIVINFSNRFFY